MIDRDPRWERQSRLEDAGDAVRPLENHTSRLARPIKVVRDNSGFRFHIFQEDNLTLVFWQEGAIVCVLVSRLPREEVIKLAFAKAMRAA